MPRDPDRAVLVRRALQDRLLETLRYLADEIEVRRVGGLGEAQAAGYVAGRLQRAEQHATVMSFEAPTARTGTLVAMIMFGAGISLLPVIVPQRASIAAALILLIAIAALFWTEVEGSALSNVFGRRTSQSVVGVRAASAGEGRERVRVVLTAPLDGAPRLPARSVLLLVLEVFGLLTVVLLWLLITMLLPLRWVLLTGACLLALMVVAILVGQWQRRLQPAIAGAGELAVLIAVAEELGVLERVELWTVAVGAASVTDAGMLRLFQSYPFESGTCFVNLHHMTAGQPVFVTREGSLREVRSSRRLLALASEADAADVTINAEPRQLRARTLAAQPLRRGYPAISISSHPDGRGIATPDPGTLERCVRLIVGMIRQLDAEETAA
jgi:hypothetical protein